MDETYPIYLNRVARMTLPDTYRTQVQFIQASPKYQRGTDGQYHAKPFPGYTIITPPWKDLNDDPETIAVYELLERCQQQLFSELGADLFIPVPAASFHLTLADLIWEGAYHDAIANHPDFETALQQNIAKIFEQAQHLGDLQASAGTPLKLQVLGLTLMPRAIAVCLAPTDELTHHRLGHLRRLMYQNSDLMALGIEQQYGFTAHITVGYFGNVADDFDPEHVCKALASLNDAWLGTRNLIDASVAELRKFDDMTAYYRQDHWPVFHF